MTEPTKPLGGLLEGFARGEDGRLFKLDLTTGEPNTGKPTNLDVIIDAALTDSTDPTHQDKINNAKTITDEYIKTSETKADKIKSFLEYYSDPNNITIEDAHIFTNMVREVKNIDETIGGNSLAQKNPDILKTGLSSNLGEITTIVKTGPSNKLPFRGGYTVQTGGTVGMFESLKSALGIDEYWKKNAIHSYLYSTAFKIFKEKTSEMFDKKYETPKKIELLQKKINETGVTHNFSVEQIRDIIIRSPGFYSSKEEDTPKAVQNAYDFINDRKPNKRVGTLNDEYRTYRNDKKITELQEAYPGYNKDTMKYIIEKLNYNLDYAKAFIEKCKNTIDKSKINEMFIKELSDKSRLLDHINDFKKQSKSSDYPDDIVSEPFGIDTSELSGLSFALAKIFNFLKGVLTVPVGLSGAVIVMTIGIAELAVKPGLLAVDLTASMIAALFQNIKDAKFVPTSDNFGAIAELPGGSKKTRHRKKNTKKNKKRKRRNTNRK